MRLKVGSQVIVKLSEPDLKNVAVSSFNNEVCEIMEIGDIKKEWPYRVKKSDGMTQVFSEWELELTPPDKNEQKLKKVLGL